MTRPTKPMRRSSPMTYDNEAIVRNAYHTAEGNVQDIPGWIGSFKIESLGYGY